MADSCAAAAGGGVERADEAPVADGVGVDRHRVDGARVLPVLRGLGEDAR